MPLFSRIPQKFVIRKLKVHSYFFQCLSTLSIEAYNNDYISINFDNKYKIQYSNIFLRDACKSEKSVDPHSKQKLFTTAELIDNLSLNNPPVVLKDLNTNEDILKVEWNQNGTIHTSMYPRSFLENYSTNEVCRKGIFFEHDQIIWNNNTIMKDISSLNVDYKDYMKDDKFFFKTVKSLNKYGLSFVNNIPDPLSNGKLKNMTEENASEWPVSALASKFGYIKKTFYGTLFDVKNKKDAENIAYTNTYLPLHMDLLYYESPPGIQLLHFIQNSTIGGENIFCDSFLAVDHIRKIDFQAYFALTKVPITYQYDNNNEYYYYSRPLVVENDLIIDSRTNYPFIKEVNYSPPFQGPFEFGITIDNCTSSSDYLDTENNFTHKNISHHLFKDFLRGLKIFEDFINDPKNHYQIKMKEGSCVIFDNRRVLHSRLQFSDENKENRWLMGCYVDGDSYRSKLRSAYRKFK